MKKNMRKIFALLCVLAMLLSLVGCDMPDLGTLQEELSSTLSQYTEQSNTSESGTSSDNWFENWLNPDINDDTDDSQPVETGNSVSFDLGSIPEYSSSPYVVINGNNPYFEENDYTTEAFEYYSKLDSLGRCGVAYANICKELMPTENRGDISSVKPSGWVQKAYSFVNGGYLYNRCHIIGFQLAGENDNELNLITGTRYMNVDGMLPFENLVDDYVDETNNHVLYRVTPVYDGDNLVASGVLMEAWSVEDEGDGICFCVYCYNVQPGVEIDYATGESWESGSNGSSDTVADASTSGSTEDAENQTYILNTKTMKFHDPDCSSVEDMSASNKKEYTGSREDLIDQGYAPCGRCDP